VEDDCTNGVDDDSDSAVDCADDDCTTAGFQCVDVPETWQGPFVLDEPSTCADDWALEELTGGSGVTAGDPDCGCECGDPSCTGVVYLHLYDDTTCSAAEWMGALGGPGCYDTPSSASTDSTMAVGALTLGNACSAEGLVVDLPAVSFVEPIAACGTAELGSGCEDDVCAPPTESALCVLAEGDLACPDGYPNGLVVFTSYVDMRDCECACEPAGDCDPELELFGQDGCSENLAEIPADSTCNTVSAGAVESALVTTPNAVCDMTSTWSTGDVSPTEPYTICCQE
jgi:hypothetical protein